MEFHGKKIVITGASPDFGQTLAILFAGLGAELYLSARSLEKAQITANLVKAQYPETKIHCFQANITKSDEITAFARAVHSITASVDILINNAALWLEGQVSEVDDASIVEAISSTATGSILVTKHFLPLLNNSNNPDIIFINSTASLPNNSHATCNEAFSAAKAAQSTFADRLRSRLKGSGVRIMTIYPPDFCNPSPLDAPKWDTPDRQYLSARNVFNGIQFALSQDRICSVDQIILSNNRSAKKLV
ncbi:oxidoreductase [Oleiphilus messinensis]|uniref:Oxidoreductase n=1 Tax=Oleiphilus messinensis TaxID=141451 RepID=A0A1Y0IHW9_9GAMM|nr:SDR family oxidoreductase [Oleiphilus messinensis]ARU59023.1 oxidoreductase [Oleiphilus messinensis]